MKRRSFLKVAPLSTALYAMPQLVSCSDPITKSHIISLSFDDGFKKSFRRVAEIHENYGTKACLNVIASGHLPSFKKVDQWILPKLMGDFNDWNEFVSRGHEVMPHTWEHVKLTEVSFNEAKERLDRCFEYFSDNLDGYSNDKAVYNFAFNASNEELDLYCLKKVKAIRTGHWVLSTNDASKNDFPKAEYKDPIRLGCIGYGPDTADDFVEKEINAFLASEGGWFIINLHGLDNEGWGPVTTKYYDGLLKRLVEIPRLDLLPVGSVLEKYRV